MSLEVNIEKKLDGFTLRAAFTAGNTSTALLGASGCGKSMTLRCIAGILKPDRHKMTVRSTSTCRRSSGAWDCCSRTMRCSPI